MAYLRRDFLIWSSYRLSGFWQIFSIFVVIGMIYFAGTAIGDRSSLIEEEDGSYVAFILVGLAFMDVLLQGLGTLPAAISDNQRSGTLEPMLLAPIGSTSLLLSFWLFRFLISLVRMTAFIGFGIIVLGFWHSLDPISVLAVLVLAEVTFLAMGAFSAAFVILIKQGDPVRLAYTAATTLLGGAFFPTSVLPSWLEPVSVLIPLTHALDGIRAGLDGDPVSEILPQLMVLGVMGAIMLPAGLYAFGWSLRRAKREGSLGEY